MNDSSIQVPFDDQVIKLLHAGDMVHLSGVLIGARDAAHARLVKVINSGEHLPLPLNNQVIYYVGPAPAKPGHVIGPAGPTTSGRMDAYTIPLLQNGVKGFIGKGYRSAEIKSALIEYQAVYLATIGGAAALLSRNIKSSRIIAYPELGTEAIYELVVEDFPAVVVNDIYGGDAYIDGRNAYLSGKYGHEY